MEAERLRKLSLMADQSSEKHRMKAGWLAWEREREEQRRGRQRLTFMMEGMVAVSVEVRSAESSEASSDK